VYVEDMETLIQKDQDKTIRIEEEVIEVETKTGSETFALSEEDKYDAALALLGDAPNLDERMPSAEKLANDSSLSEGELKAQAANAIEALKLRAEKIAQLTKEQEEKDRKLQIEARKRQRHIDALEQIYLSSQTGRKRIKSQQSQNIAAALYARGIKVPGIDEEVDEEFGAASASASASA
jgi:N-acetylmuramoyl-L-alanine amidase